MRLLLATIVGIGVLAGAAPARGDDDLLARAQRAYADQRYADAARLYEEAVSNGLRHEDVYYNLGNAYYRAGNLGRAILSYERALRLAPDAEDAAFNLEVARDAVAARYGRDAVAGADQDPLWMRVVQWLPLKTLLLLVVALDVLFFGVLVVLRFLPSGPLRTGLVVGNVFAGVAGLVLAVLLVGRIHFLENIRVGIVVADEVVMREGPDHTRREMPTLHAGHRVVVLRESQGWVRVRLANQMEGWVPSDTVEQI